MDVLAALMPVAVVVLLGVALDLFLRSPLMNSGNDDATTTNCPPVNSEASSAR